MLSEEGVSHWSEIVAVVYIYIGMFRHHCHSPDGLPSYIYDELKTIQKIAYEYQDETSPDELVELVAEASTCSYLPADRLLDGNSVLQSFNGEAIKNLLDDYFRPMNSRVDLTSSSFGRDADFVDGRSNDDNAVMKEMASSNGEKTFEFAKRKFGEPKQECNFGTRYWCENIDAGILAEWEDLSQPRIAPKLSLLELPPLNPFLPTKLDLKPLPDAEDDAHHPLTEEKETHEQDPAHAHFPAIPPAAPESHLPRLISDNKKGVRLYHLQDRKFKRPIAELRMRIVCAGGNQTPFVRACSDLFVTLMKDSLIELCYQASTCELGSNISIDDIGFPIRVHGFDDKLLDLASEILSVFFSFRDVNRDGELPASIKAGRFEACVEMLIRNYRNFGIKASQYSANVRLRCIRPTTWSSDSKVSLSSVCFPGTTIY